MFPSLGSRSLRDAARTGKLVRPAGRSSYAFSATAPLTFWLPRGRKCTGTMDWSSYPQRQKGNIMSQQGRGERCSRDDLLLEVSLHDQYGVLDDGSIDDADLRHDGTDRDVIGYLCDNCYQSFTEWAEALAHVGGSSQEGRS
jgi:hypothetical protein